MKNTIQIVEDCLKKSLHDLFGINGNVNVTNYDSGDVYDYQSPFAMMYFKKIKNLKNENLQFKSPKELSQYLKEKLSLMNDTIFQQVEVSNNNFLLLQLKDNYLLEEMNNLLMNDIKVEPSTKKEKIVVDFSSPNIAKEMHVGHLRSTIMGESICRVLEFLGNEVKRMNHLGDWGTQFGMLIAHLIDQYPDYLNKTPNLSDLETFYKESKKRFDLEPEFKKEAQQYVVKLQSGDEVCTKAWKILCKISKEFFKVIYKRLDITNEEYGESFYNPMIPSLLDELKDKKLVKMDQGALCMFLPKDKVPLMLVKSDGGFNYDTTDMAAARYRLIDLKANRIIYLTDVGQWTHFKKIFQGAQMAGWYNPKKQRMEHMGFGVILGPDGKRMKTRSGKTVKLMSLLDDAKEQAKEQLMNRFKSDDNEDEDIVKTTQINKENIDKYAEVLGVSAIKYYDLRQNRIQDYKFILENMVNQKGDTAVYLMYSYIRLCSILRKSKFNEEDLKKEEFQFTHEQEKVLVRHLVKFPEVINYVSDNLALNFLCKYLYVLASRIAEVYSKYKINNNEHSKNRIKLIFVVKKMMEKCFYLLGIETIDKI